MLWESSSPVISAMPTCSIPSIGPTEDRTCKLTEQEKTYKTFCDATRNSSHFYNSGHTKLDKYAEVWTPKHWGTFPSERPHAEKVLFLKKFLCEFEILRVVYMLNGTQMRCHSAASGHRGFYVTVAFDLFLAVGKMNRSIYDVTGVRVALFEDALIAFSGHFLTSLY